MIEIIDGQEQIIVSIGSEKRKKLATKLGMERVQLNQLLYAGSLAKAPPNKTKAEIAAIDAANAKKDSPVVARKTSSQKSEQATKLFEKTKQEIEKISEQSYKLTVESDNLFEQMNSAKSKVPTKKMKKESSDHGDIFKFAKALDEELATGNFGQPTPVMRQKANKKQVAELNNKYEELQDKQFKLQYRRKQLTLRANRLYDASFNA